MILFEKITLDNGLRVIVHTDKTTPFARLTFVIMLDRNMRILSGRDLHTYLNTLLLADHCMFPILMHQHNRRVAPIMPLQAMILQIII